MSCPGGGSPPPRSPSWRSSWRSPTESEAAVASPAPVGRRRRIWWRASSGCGRCSTASTVTIWGRSADEEPCCPSAHRGRLRLALRPSPGSSTCRRRSCSGTPWRRPRGRPGSSGSPTSRPARHQVGALRPDQRGLHRRRVRCSSFWPGARQPPDRRERLVSQPQDRREPRRATCAEPRPPAACRGQPRWRCVTACSRTALAGDWAAASCSPGAPGAEPAPGVLVDCSHR